MSYAHTRKPTNAQLATAAICHSALEALGDKWEVPQLDVLASAASDSPSLVRMVAPQTRVFLATFDAQSERQSSYTKSICSSLALGVALGLGPITVFRDRLSRAVHEADPVDYISASVDLRIAAAIMAVASSNEIVYVKEGLLPSLGALSDAVFTLRAVV
jgi:hypothetical protein